jgi:hypothetical protein
MGRSWAAVPAIHGQKCEWVLPMQVARGSLPSLEVQRLALPAQSIDDRPILKAAERPPTSLRLVILTEDRLTSRLG